MGYEIQKDEKQVTITPRLEQPYIYLDVGAIYNIAEDRTSLSTSFFAAFDSCNATLCLSSHTIGEIWLRDPGPWFKSFLEFWDSIGDRFLFMEFDFFRVIRRERIKAPYDGSSAYDASFTKEIFKSYFLKKNVAPNLRYLFEDTFKRSKRLHEHRKGHERFLKNIRRRLIHFRKDNAHKKPPTIVQGPHYTQTLLQNILINLVKDRSWKIALNDVSDLYHTVVPVSWCDFVVLDKHWNDIVRRAYRKYNHPTRVYKLSKMRTFISDLKRLGPKINAAHVTNLWKYALAKQWGGTNKH